jgi:hypothetical protein
MTVTTRDSRIWPKAFVGLPTKDLLSWLDHFDNITGYCHWTDNQKIVEVRTLFNGIGAHGSSYNKTKKQKMIGD